MHFVLAARINVLHMNNDIWVNMALFVFSLRLLSDVKLFTIVNFSIGYCIIVFTVNKCDYNFLYYHNYRITNSIYYKLLYHFFMLTIGA